MGDRYDRLDGAERWFADALRVVEPAGFFEAVDVDMARSQVLIERLRQNNIKATYTHLFVRAAALALTKHPHLHQLVAGTRRVYPERIDIGVSVAGTTFCAPVMIIEDAGNKTLEKTAVEIVTRTPQVREKEVRDLAVLRRWGRLVPAGWLRRALVRWLQSQIWFRRSVAGTFQVTSVPSVDLLVPFMFSAAAALGVARVRDRVVVVDGKPAVRPIVTLACCADHKVWDGMRAATFLVELKRILEDGDLETEVNVALS